MISIYWLHHSCLIVFYGRIYPASYCSLTSSNRSYRSPSTLECSLGKPRSRAASHTATCCEGQFKVIDAPNAVRWPALNCMVQRCHAFQKVVNALLLVLCHFSPLKIAPQNCVWISQEPQSSCAIHMPAVPSVNEPSEYLNSDCWQGHLWLKFLPDDQESDIIYSVYGQP